MRKQAGTKYDGKLASFGDAKLDEMDSYIKERKPREVAPGTERCPSCGNMRFLRKGFYATLCEDCHQDIERLAAPGRIWK